MKRLTEKTVFSGFVTACRRAKRPTRRSPLGVTATTDGVSRSPSAFGMTVGSPPSMVAITELVVPRSIPIVRAMLVLSFYPNIPNVRATRANASSLLPVLPSCRLLAVVFARPDFDYRRSQDTVAEPVSRRIDRHDGVSTGGVGLDGFVHRRVERLSERLDWCHTMFLQRRQEFLLDPAHALSQLRLLLIGRQGAESTLQVVQYRNDLPQELLVRGQPLLGPLLLDAPSIVGEIRRRALELVKVSVAFGYHCCQLGIWFGRFSVAILVELHLRRDWGILRICHLFTPLELPITPSPLVPSRGV